MNDVPTIAGTGLFRQLRDGCEPEWHAYTRHAFVLQLAEGTLPLAAFQHYLVQDYLFLIQFARAYALAAYKADDLDDIRQASATAARIVDIETSMHLKYCARWGLDEAAVVATPESNATMAYTRYVLERGMAGDLLDLQAALVPCVVGYAEIAAERLADPSTRLDGNPYREWLETYGGADYQAVAASAVAGIDRQMARRGGPGRIASLQATFRAATRLEAQFWQMGLDRS